MRLFGKRNEVVSEHQSSPGIDPFIDMKGIRTAKELMDPTNETYDAVRNQDGSFGEYGFLAHNPTDGSGVGSVYDFPFPENTGITGRMRRNYVDWLDGLAEVSGTSIEPELRDATAKWLAQLVVWREQDPQGVLS